MSVLACIFYFVTDISVMDLSSGFSHPLEGWDHIVTMLGVGIWAAQLRGKAIWLLPTTFVGVMSLGGISGAAKYLAVPSAEILIVLSCLVFSFLIIRKVRFDIKINVLIVAFFAFFHGYAHGAEISTSASLISYTLGFMIATLLLHGAGILVAKVVLISIAFFIAQALNVVSSTESIKTVTSYTQVAQSDFEQLETKSVEKPPLINLSPQWRSFSPPLESILQLFTFIKTYFVLCALLLVFSVSQFVCYVFYIKQRRNFVFSSKSLARCFNFRFISYALPFSLSRFSVSNIYFIFFSIFRNEQFSMRFLLADLVFLLSLPHAILKIKKPMPRSVSVCAVKGSQNAELILSATQLRNYINYNFPLGGNMKKVVSILVMAIVVIGLSGCIDGQDDNGGKLPAGKTLSNVQF
jgi:hydrogenase/urease accessory protein HupE